MSGLDEGTKTLFRTTITTIRTKLLAEIADAADRRYSLAAKDRSKLRLSAMDAARYERLQDWLSSPERPHKDRAANLALLVKERAYTLVNRLVILFQLEARGLRTVQLVSRGVEKSEFSRYSEFFSALTKAEDRGWNFVLQQVWDDLALELPALFAWNEELECLPLPGLSVVGLIDTLADPALASAWTDDTTLGWLYQYWNDPDREAVDEKLRTTTGKVEAHELASKTQLFTERYMVEWLVQNSLGAQWLAMCGKNGWETRAKTVLGELRKKREDFARRRGGAEGEREEKKEKQGNEITIRIDGDEEFWKFYVEQEISEETVEAVPGRLEEVRILDPAMGSGHFLVYVFDFLFELYREQAGFLGEAFVPSKVVAAILERNIHGIDIDNRAVQIAAAALYLKARKHAPDYRITRLSIVATDLGLGSIKDSDPSLRAFYHDLERETGITEIAARRIIEGLRGADYLGSLLDINTTIKYLAEYFGTKETTAENILDRLGDFMRHHDSGGDLGLGRLAGQLGKGLRLIEILGHRYDVVVANPPYLGLAKADDALAENMQAGYSAGKGDLYSVFMLRGLELARGNGHVAMVTPRGWMFISSFEELRKHLFANHSLRTFGDLDQGAFSDMKDVSATMFAIERGFKLGNLIHFNRPVIKTQIRRDQFQPGKNQRGLALQHRIFHFLQSRFAEIPGAPMIYWWPEEFRSIYIKADKLGKVGKARQGLATADNNRFLRAIWEVEQANIPLLKNFDDRFPKAAAWSPYIKGAEGKRWYESPTFILNVKCNRKEKYVDYSQNGSGGNENPFKDFFERQGLAFSYIGTNGFLCRLRKYKSIFDVSGSSIFCDNPEKMQVLLSSSISGYVSQSINPTINNQVGDIENLPVLDLLADHSVYLARATSLYDRLFASTETNIEYRYEDLSPETFEVEEARIRDEIDKEIFAHFQPATVAAIYEEIGVSPFDYPKWDGVTMPEGFAEAYQASDSILELSHRFALHPDSLLAIVAKLGLVHESRWQDLAWKHLSWAIGVLLGRFDAKTGGLAELGRGEELGRGVSRGDAEARSLGEWGRGVSCGDAEGAGRNLHGLIYLSALDVRDSLAEVRRPYLGDNAGTRCVATLRAILEERWGRDKAVELWGEIEAALVSEDKRSDVGEWLRLDAFERHCKLYENRPIYFPLVSTKKNFFVWVNIHRWNAGTLNAVLANYLKPELQTLESRIRHLREEIVKSAMARDKNSLENEVSELDKYREELAAFAVLVSRIAEKGPDPSLQEVEVPFEMDLDDGVMVNSGARWELMKPLWKKPAEWWGLLSKPSGKKDFDWSHLAMRYWPKRVMEKVKKDPSLAVAHSDYGNYKGRDLFEELHPDAAKKWREQEEKGAAGKKKAAAEVKSKKVKRKSGGDDGAGLGLFGGGE